MGVSSSGRIRSPISTVRDVVCWEVIGYHQEPSGHILDGAAVLTATVVGGTGEQLVRSADAERTTGSCGGACDPDPVEVGDRESRDPADELGGVAITCASQFLWQAVEDWPQ